jgi:EipB-like
MHHPKLSQALLVGCLAVLVGLSPGQAAETSADGIVLAPHRAVYDLKLTDSRGKQSVESARGRILYDFSGSPCEGYTLQFRQVTQLDSGEGKVAVSDLRASNWEEGGGKAFRFVSTNVLNGSPGDSAEGHVERQGERIVVSLKKPQAKTLDIRDVVFPSDHMRRIIAAAREGKSLLQIGVYDGAETGEKVYNTLTVIGQAMGPERAVADAGSGQKALEGLKRWPVTVSYFDRSKSDGDQTPLYSISFETYENGISRALKLDYGDFVLGGDMTTLEVKEAKACP